MGIHLVGGGAMLRGFDLRIAHETGVPVRLVDAPARDASCSAPVAASSRFDRLRDMFMDRPRT